MHMSKNLVFIIILLALAIIFLYVAETTHIEFFYHLAAIPLEVLLAVFIVEKIMEKREIRRKKKELMYLKSYLFRSGMRRLFIANFAALKAPPITIRDIIKGSLDQLTDMRRQAESVDYLSPADMEKVVMEYVRAEPVWINFMNRAMHFGFDAIFHDMIDILHFIYDVKEFKKNSRGRLFVEAACENSELQDKILTIIGDGIRKFLDYAIELKRDEPAMFNEVMTVFDLSLPSENSQPLSQRPSQSVLKKRSTR